MQSKLFLSALFALSLAVVSQAADTIVAFSGNFCDGDEGLTVPCDGSCHQFGGRHSVFVNGIAHVAVTFFADPGCPFDTSDPVVVSGGDTIPVNGDTCVNVNTGGPVASFACNSEGNL